MRVQLREAHAALRLVACRSLRACRQVPVIVRLLCGIALVATLVLTARTLLQRIAPSELSDTAAVEVDVVFVTDCAEYQEWMTQVFLEQWRHAGRHSPNVRLTRVLACDDDDPRLPRILAQSEAFRPDGLEVFRLPELNGKGKERYLCHNRPRGLRRWLKERPPRSLNHWIALLDPDMLLLRPLNTAVPWRLAGGAAGTLPSWRLEDVPQGVALAHHFAFVPQVWQNTNLSLTQLCEGPGEALPSCRERMQDLFLDKGLVEEKYAVGVPHMIRAVDLQRMGEAWEVMTNQVRAQYRGWTAEMLSWILAARYAGISFAYLNEVVTDPAAAETAWESVDFGAASAGEPNLDACGADTKSVASSTAGPWVVHYCEVYNVTYQIPGRPEESMIFDKRAANRSLKAAVKAETIPNVSSLLDCAAPLFELPPANTLTVGGPASASLFRRSAWILCTMLRAINTGLSRYKERHCPPDATLGSANFRAEPIATQVADLFAGFGERRRKATTVDWAEKLRATQERIAKRQGSTTPSPSRRAEPQ